MSDSVRIIDCCTQEFAGNLYRIKSDGYYRRVVWNKGHAKECLLHVDVWTFFNGKIPTGHEIHHVDGNKSNNEIENLQCMSKAEHTRLHMLARPLIKHVCEKCGREFFSRSPNAKLCSNRCNRAAWVAAHQEERVCVICGRKFSTYYERNSQTCSPSCRSKLTWQSRNHITDEQRAEIRRLYKPRDKNFGSAALAEKYGVSRETIRLITRNE